MTPEVMTSVEEPCGPKNLKKKIFFIFFNKNEQTSTLFLLRMQKSQKSTHPIAHL
jgi:hypothetical protein